jgi:phosphate:Na+ symporter
LAIEQSRKEILKMGVGCLKMMSWFQEVLVQDTPDKQLVDRLRHREQVLDTVQEEIAAFVTGLFSDSMPHSVAEEARQQLRMAHEYESISDYLASLLKLDQGLRKKDQRFSERQRGDLLQLHAAVTAFLQSVQDANLQQNRHILPKLAASRKEIRELIKRLQREQLEALSAESTSPQTLVGYMAALNAYSRIRNHSQNVAEAIACVK